MAARCCKGGKSERSVRRFAGVICWIDFLAYVAEVKAIAFHRGELAALVNVHAVAQMVYDARVALKAGIGPHQGRKSSVLIAELCRFGDLYHALEGDRALVPAFFLGSQFCHAQFLAVAAQRAMRMEKRDLDVGVFGSRNFVYVASFGAFTRTTYTVPQDIKNMFGHFAYMLEGVKDLETLRPYRMTITADGEPIRGEYLFGAVSNSTSIAGLMKISPEKVSFNDGQFELLLVPVPKSPQAVQALIRALVYQDYESSAGLIFRHVKHVVAETEENIPWTLDGEYAPGAPRIEIGIEDNGIQMLL